MSNDTVAQTRGLRSKRHRQTASGDDSVKLPLAKKRRSALHPDTFEPPSGPAPSHKIEPHSNDSQLNGSIHHDKRSISATQTQDLALRGSKKTEKRLEKGTGQQILSTNDYYTISQLPALPDQIRSRPTVPYSCTISPAYDYVLALSHTDALIWPYNSSSTVPSPREVVSFKLPFPPATAEDPLPLAAFTARSANGEPGVVVVSPKWGRIVYWETISNASSTIAGQASEGVQASIPGMFRGELVNELITAEPAGFILSMAQGRVAQLTVRDQMGRPGIGIQFMRKSTTSATRGGIFGSIRNVLGSDRRKGAPIVRAGKLARAQRDIAISTQDGEIEFWTNNLITGNVLHHTTPTKDSLLQALTQLVATEDIQQPLHFKVLDICFAITPASQRALVRQDIEHAESIVMLVAVSGREKALYYLVETTISSSEAHVQVVHPVRCYGDGILETADWRPRICMHEKGTSAFILFEKALVVMSLAHISETPNAQFQAEQVGLPDTFQDCVRFQQNTSYKIVNYAVEEHADNLSCVLAVQGFGMVRVLSHIKDMDDVDIEDVASHLGAKTKIEQAIFFGMHKANPFDLQRKSESSYDVEEIRWATLEISLEILSSTSQYLPSSYSSTAELLQQKARSLQDLIEFVSEQYPKSLRRRDRFVLLWNAEKLAAAQAIWRMQEQIQSTYPHGDERDSTYLEFVLKALHETRQKYPDRTKGEVDHVRHWLVHSVFRIDHVLSELGSSLKALSEWGIKDPRVICDYLLEAVDIWTAAYRAAFEFRDTNAKLYGLGNEPYEDGVLTCGYPVELNHVWTSAPEPLKYAQELIQDVCQFLDEWWDYNLMRTSHRTKGSRSVPTDLEGNAYPAPSKETLNELAARLPEQVQLFSKIAKEANIQSRLEISADGRTDQEKEVEIQATIQRYRPAVRQAIEWVAPYNREGSIRLAEDLKDTDLLVDVNLAYLADLAEQKRLAPKEGRDISGIDKQIRRVQARAETYFDKFGKDWAYSHYSSMVARQDVGHLLSEAQVDGGRKQEYLTWFFEASANHGQHLGKIFWINAVIGEQRFDVASGTLASVAQVEETDIFAHKTELCLAKLAGLAAAELDQAPTPLVTVDLKDELEYIRITESLAFLVEAFVRDAIDHKARLDLAVDTFIPDTIRRSKKLQDVQRQLTFILSKVIDSQILSLSELVDGLTLLQLDQVRINEEDFDVDVDDLYGREFVFAMRAIRLCPSREADDKQKRMLTNVVWRRLLIKDDWTQLNNTAGKSDAAVKNAMQQTHLYTTLWYMLEDAGDADAEVRIPAVEDMLQPALSSTSATTEEKMPEELRHEILKLRSYVDKARLSEHFVGLVKEAKDAVRQAKDAQGEAMATEAERVQANGNEAHA